MKPLLYALLIAAVSVAGCEPGTPEEAASVQLVRVVQVREGRLRHLLSFYGVLEPVIRARLAFQSPGVISTRPAQMGQAVRAGELLATLDNPDLGPSQKAAAARLQESLTQRDQAERDLVRLRSLAQTGAVGQEQVEQKAAELASLQANVARAEADLAGTRQRLEDATLLAPFDGVISLVQVEPGEFVSAGQAVMAIGGLDKVEVRVLLPASLVSELDNGDLLSVKVPQLDENEAKGVVTEVSSIGEKETGLFPVTVELSVDPATTMIRPGMQAEVLLDYADVTGFIVPLAAIVDPVGGDPRIFIINGEHVSEVPASILAIADEEVAIKTRAAALGEGDQVVIAGHRSLTDGQQVRVVK
ncbi:MAG: efflux RND transporter periplasmic adaptor subunit [Xanthomonadales bacterium]|nr:efflux RND transporter periplasmic adaptor subunit [Gammaproteobacteria bacterium]NND56011.1 efflux RND transporter periplasmic adaptor subunit [Xanthomonadales bacterium]NNK52072.1 efflux RND transporter periplasmic adaptor subunit [Xanthomonadales bacterium]